MMKSNVNFTINAYRKESFDPEKWKLNNLTLLKNSGYSEGEVEVLFNTYNPLWRPISCDPVVVMECCNTSEDVAEVTSDSIQEVFPPKGYLPKTSFRVAIGRLKPIKVFDTEYNALVYVDSLGLRYTAVCIEKFITVEHQLLDRLEEALILHLRYRQYAALLESLPPAPEEIKLAFESRPFVL